MSLTEDQLKDISQLSIWCSAATFVTTIICLVVYTNDPKVQEITVAPLVARVLASELFLSIGGFFRIENHAQCVAQGWLTHYFSWTVLLFVSAITFVTHCQESNKWLHYEDKVIKRSIGEEEAVTRLNDSPWFVRCFLRCACCKLNAEKFKWEARLKEKLWVFNWIWVIALVLSLPPAFTPPVLTGGSYDFSTGWCWIRNDRIGNIYKWAIFYVEFWMLIIYMGMFWIIVSCWGVEHALARSVVSTAARFEQHENHQEERKEGELPMADLDVSAVLVRVHEIPNPDGRKAEEGNELIDGAGPSSDSRKEESQEEKESEVDQSKLNNPSDAEEIKKSSFATEMVPPTSQRIAEENPDNPSNPPRKVSDDEPGRVYKIRAFVYPLLLFLFYVPTTVNRAFTTAGYANFGLVAAACIGYRFRGVANAVYWMWSTNVLGKVFSFLKASLKLC